MNTREKLLAAMKEHRRDKPDCAKCPYCENSNCVTDMLDEIITFLEVGLETVDHPDHYNRAMECIEEMEIVFGTQAVMIFCLLNIWKYRYRASDKNGSGDLDKSDWYMKKYSELKGRPIKIRDTEL